MPKKGLIAIPGMISASGSEGFGLMQMPPVSGNAEQNGSNSFKKVTHYKEFDLFYSADFPKSVIGANKGQKYLKNITRSSDYLGPGSRKSVFVRI